MAKTIEEIRDDFVKTIRSEMEGSHYMLFTLRDLRIEHDLDPKMIGKLLRRFTNAVKAAMPEFEIKYMPNWDAEIEVRKTQK